MPSKFLSTLAIKTRLEAVNKIMQLHVSVNKAIIVVMFFVYSSKAILYLMVFHTGYICWEYRFYSMSVRNAWIT